MANPLDFFVSHASSIKYRLGFTGARLPFFPAGTNYNVGWAFNGIIPLSGQSLQQIVSNPATGPIWLDGIPKKFWSAIGEYTIINQDPSNAIDICFTSSNAEQTEQVVWMTIGSGGFWNEQNREINPTTMFLRPHNAGVSVILNCVAIGSDE